ncbi:hypothetical protein EVAR_63217_1 [Eumeta japonica]|uniref:Uncharacterized protein n=1 Tax=Eumeta variegata TaxID=151549 RepID=A0A4C1ZF27_EUMVA|nr:hypothetical protein EVAR_63217_1 [Eumeta japonica]
MSRKEQRRYHGYVIATGCGSEPGADRRARSIPSGRVRVSLEKWQPSHVEPSLGKPEHFSFANAVTTSGSALRDRRYGTMKRYGATGRKRRASWSKQSAHQHLVSRTPTRVLWPVA